MNRLIEGRRESFAWKRRTQRKEKKKEKNVQLESNVIPTNNVGRLDYYQANGHFLPDTGIISPRLRPRKRKKTKKTQNSP